MPGLAYFLSNEIPESNLMPYSEADFQRLKVRRVMGQVTRLDLATHKVFLAGVRV
jgi:hypothetical protein